MPGSATSRRLTALRHPERLDEILDAACQAIVERGFSDTRVSDIAEVAGTSTGTIHYYFDSKQDVLMAALRWASDRLFGRLESADGPDATARLAALLDSAIPYGPEARHDEYVLWTEVWALVLRSPEHLPALQDLSERWRAFFFDVVAWAKALWPDFARASDLCPLRALCFAMCFGRLGVAMALEPADPGWFEAPVEL